MQRKHADHLPLDRIGPGSLHRNAGTSNVYLSGFAAGRRLSLAGLSTGQVTVPINKRRSLTTLKTGGISMSTPKSKATLKLSFLGDENSPLASSLEGYANLTPYINAAHDINALVIDGGTTSSTDDAEAVQTTLDAGKPVAIVNPTQQQIDSIAQLTDTPMTGQPDVIVYTRGADVSGSPSYQTIALSSNPSESWTASDAGPEVTQDSASTTTTVLPGSTIAEILERSMTNSQAAELSIAAMADASSASQLTPPLGATYGVKSSSIAYSYFTQVTEDKTAKTGTQYPTVSMNADSHVYYVDGEGGTPYYYVIVKLTGSLGPGTMLANNKNSLGFFQYGATHSVTITDENGHPFQNGVTLLRHSPQNYNGGSAPVEIVLPMTLMVNSGGGKSPQQFTATEETSTYIDQWAVQDQTNSSGPGWYYHQVGTWDPTVNPPNEFHDWWGDVYDGSDHVEAMPSLSYSTLTGEMFAAWRFDGSLFKPGTRSLWVQFDWNWGQSRAFLHNPDGCDSGGHHHLYYGTAQLGTTWGFDLASIAVPTGQ
jgi:hypothetical protein